jgi:hypothetical protein
LDGVVSVLWLMLKAILQKVTQKAKRIVSRHSTCDSVVISPSKQSINVIQRCSPSVLSASFIFQAERLCHSRHLKPGVSG